MRIVSWNVNGIRACYKKNMMNTLAQIKPDILCLQETKAHREQVEKEAQNLGFHNSVWLSATRKGYSGVATFFNNIQMETLGGLGIEEYDSEGRVIHQVIFVDPKVKINLFNIYFPNGGSGDERHQFKQKFLADLLNQLEKLLKKNESIIVVGDYNVAHSEIDVYDPVRLSRESGFLPEERQWMSRFLDAGFIDCFRHFHASEKERYSWWSYRELARIGNRGWRIDYVCCSKDLLPFLKASDILDQIEGSDHCPVYADFLFK